MKKRDEDEASHFYELEGEELLGSYLRVQKHSDEAAQVSDCAIQWYRVTSDSGKKELISGIICSASLCKSSSELHTWVLESPDRCLKGIY